MDLKQRIWTEIGNTIGQAMDLDDVRRYLRDSGPDVNNITEWAVLWQAVMANDRAKALICRDCQERSDSTMWIFLLRQSFESYINGWRVFMRSASQQNDANTLADINGLIGSPQGRYRDANLTVFHAALQCLGPVDC